MSRKEDVKLCRRFAYLALLITLPLEAFAGMPVMDPCAQAYVNAQRANQALHPSTEALLSIETAADFSDLLTGSARQRQTTPFRKFFTRVFRSPEKVSPEVLAESLAETAFARDLDVGADELRPVVHKALTSASPMEAQASLHQLLFTKVSGMAGAAQDRSGLVDLVRMAETAALTEPERVDIVAKTPFAQRLGLSRVDIARSFSRDRGIPDALLQIEMDRYISNRASRCSTYSGFAELLQDLKISGLGRERAREVLKKTPYFESIEAPAAVRERFLDHSLNGSEGLDTYIANAKSDLANRLKKRLGADLDPKNFRSLVFRLFRSKMDLKKVRQVLESSEFAQYYRIDSKRLDGLLDRISWLHGRGEFIRPEEIENALSVEFPRWEAAGKKIPGRAYDFELPPMKIRNQCKSGSCWLHAATLESEALLRKELGRDVSVSVDYLLAHSIRMRAETAFAKMWMNRPTKGEFWKIKTNGGTFEEALALQKAVGLLPESGWFPVYHEIPSKSIFEHAEDFKDELENLLWHLRPDQHEELTEEQAMEKFRKGMAEIFQRWLGGLPDPDQFKFKIGSKTYTPKTLLSVIDSKGAGGVVSEHQSSKNYRSDFVLFLGLRNNEKKFPHLNTRHERNGKTREEIEKTIIDRLSQGRPIYFSYSSPKDKTKFINDLTGKMSVPPGTNQETSGAHAVAIVGYDLDLDGRIRAFKVQNSWGKQSGDRGIYHVTPEFFWTFFQGISYRVPE